MHGAMDNMAIQVPVSTGIFNTTALMTRKRLYDETWTPRKRRCIFPSVVPQSYLGKRKQRAADEDFTSAVKRRTIFDEAERSALLIRGRIIVPPETGPWRLSGKQTDGTSIDELVGMVNGLKLDKTFPQFSRLPPELRRRIWQHTWEARAVTISRRLVAFKHGQPMGVGYDPSYEWLHRYTHEYKTHLVRSNHWGVVDPRYHRKTWFEKAIGKDLVTSTTSDSAPPASLFVNHESRHETLLHFQPAFSLDGGHTNVYFNFGLDTMKLSRHYSLGMCFGVNDLHKLRSITIPELSPHLPCFGHRIGPNDYSRSRMVLSALVPPVADGTIAYYPEFYAAWMLLRWHFPNLRVINLEPVSDCRLHDSTLALTPRGLAELIREATYHDVDKQVCFSCLNLQLGSQRFPQIGLNTPYLQQIFDASGIFGPPIYRQRRVIIGCVKAASEAQKDEEVTVSNSQSCSSFICLSPNT